jgi:hypothetical protein
VSAAQDLREYTTLVSLFFGQGKTKDSLLRLATQAGYCEQVLARKLGWEKGGRDITVQLVPLNKCERVLWNLMLKR